MQNEVLGRSCNKTIFAIFVDVSWAHIFVLIRTQYEALQFSNIIINFSQKNAFSRVILIIFCNFDDKLGSLTGNIEKSFFLMRLRVSIN